MTQELGREEVIRRLKVHAKPGGELDGETVSARVEGETDRGAVIILATGIEDALGEKIREKMVWLNADERGRLFGPDGPLGSFSSLIRMAYALGIIDRDHSKACDIIREMRNACAHSRRPLSFEDAVLRDAFKVLMRLVAVRHKPDLEEDIGLAKYWFGIFVGYVWQVIKFGPDVAAASINKSIDETLDRIRERIAALPSSHDKP